MTKNTTQKAPLKMWLSWLLHTWPWKLAIIAWAITVVAVCAVRHHYTGIYAFSTANYG